MYRENPLSLNVIKTTLLFPLPLYSVVESCPILAENSAWDSGPDHHYIQISKLDLVSDGQLRIRPLQAGGLNGEGLGPFAIDLLSAYPAPSHQPLSPSCPDTRRKGQETGQFLLGGWLCPLWMSQQCVQVAPPSGFVLRSSEAPFFLETSLLSWSIFVLGYGSFSSPLIWSYLLVPPRQFPDKLNIN